MQKLACVVIIILYIVELSLLFFMFLRNTIDIIWNSVNVGFFQLIRGYKQTYTIIASRCTTKHNKVTH